MRKHRFQAAPIIRCSLKTKWQNAANVYYKAQSYFQAVFNKRLPQSTFPAGAAEWNTIFRETRTKLFEQRSCEFFVRPKNRVERGKFAKQTCNRSRLSFAYFSLAKQRKVSAPLA